MYTTIDEAKDLVWAFEDRTLARSRWTHAAHLTVALWYLVHYPHPEATRRIRAGIQQYNAANGIQTTPTGGYHETITLFWIDQVHQFLTDKGVNDFALETVNALLQTYADPNLPFLFYSGDRLLSWEARTTWVEPDLRNW
ncbi:hypothetical protein K9N68_00335 [Kovacikia minuta CCNUW1]|uniref:hypothetical protein n=1 Tax=Kovacikia minuta TaxID=2931930 RepID=UPI001CCFF4E5|nr:hypothetical protein [Kovacikia minuta]UBF26498.1 hypothetical protein K9N68_00335 [Kovacikia minuta CCNUW1]